MDISIIDNAVQGNYVDFSQQISDVLSQKLQDNEKYSEFTKSKDNMEKMKSAFADIVGNTNSKEGEEDE